MHLGAKIFHDTIQKPFDFISQITKKNFKNENKKIIK